MQVYRLTLRYASGVHAQVLFSEERHAHGYYHIVVKPKTHNPPAFIVEPVEVYESAACAPPEANITKI